MEINHLEIITQLQQERFTVQMSRGLSWLWWQLDVIIEDRMLINVNYVIGTAVDVNIRSKVSASLNTCYTH